MMHSRDVVAAVAVFAVLGAACRPAAPTPDFSVPEPKKLPPIVLPVPTDFTAAQRALTELTGAEPASLKGISQEDGTDIIVPDAFSWPLDQDRVTALMTGTHPAWKAAGFYVYRCERKFGISGSPDRIALVPTIDQFEILHIADTDGANYELDNDDVIRWLRDLHAEQPFDITAAEIDSCEGTFLAPVRDADDLARRMYEFCPDLVDQGVGDVTALAKELRTRNEFYFWWD